MVRCAIVYFKAQVLQHPRWQCTAPKHQDTICRLGRICLLLTGLDSNGQVLMVLVQLPAM